MLEIPRGIDQRPMLLLIKLANEVAGRAGDPLAGLGLSGRQYLVLAILCSDEPSSQLELARVCGLAPAQVPPVVGERQRRGLVERKPDKSDRRRSIVRPKPQG